MTATTATKDQHCTERMFQATPAVVGLARDLVERQATAWVLDADIKDRAVRVVSELSTNAIQASNAHDLIKVRFWRDRTGVAVSVWDRSLERPTLKTVELTPELIDALPEGYEFGGWGLGLIEFLSSSFGIDWVKPAPNYGKWVWCRFDFTKHPEPIVRLQTEPGVGSHEAP